MKKLTLICLAIISIFISYNCQKSAIKPDLGKIRLNLPAQPFNYKTATIPGTGEIDLPFENTGQVVDNNKATIGRVLFYDKALSLNNSVACASCHLQGNAFADVSSLSKGFEEKFTVRNSMGISNLMDESGIGYFWDARETSIMNMVFAPVANHIEMGFERVDLIAQKISNLPYYQPLFKKCYGDNEITEERVRESLGHFLFSIVSFGSKFDREIPNQFANFTPEENEGMNLFMTHNCSSCHLLSPMFQNSYGSIRFANIGLDKKDADPGISGLYKIPRLKNVSKTAPYMHDGRFKTLDEVLEHYSHNIQDNPNLTFFLRDNSTNGPARLEFTEREKSALIAFLKTLDDESMTTDIKYSSPFN